MQYIEPLAKLIEHFRSLPGIGSKTAVRLAYHILDMDADKAGALARAIIEAKEKIGFCNTCFNLSDTNPCKICASDNRDRSIICVVEQPRDVAAVERMRDYKGLYHVLHGALSPLEGVGPEDIRIKELLNRLYDADVREVIVATNPNVEGEATAMYLAKLLKPAGIKVTSVLRMDCQLAEILEYADEVTLIKGDWRIVGKSENAIQAGMFLSRLQLLNVRNVFIMEASFVVAFAVGIYGSLPDRGKLFHLPMHRFFGNSYPTALLVRCDALGCQPVWRGLI